MTDIFTTTDKSSDEINRLCERIDKLETRITIMKPYIQHMVNCLSHYHDVKTPYTGKPPRQPCDCGLEAIKKQE